MTSETFRKCVFNEKLSLFIIKWTPRFIRNLMITIFTNIYLNGIIPMSCRKLLKFVFSQTIKFFQQSLNIANFKNYVLKCVYQKCYKSRSNAANKNNLDWNNNRSGLSGNRIEQRMPNHFIEPRTVLRTYDAFGVQHDYSSNSSSHLSSYQQQRSFIQQPNYTETSYSPVASQETYKYSFYKGNEKYFDWINNRSELPNYQNTFNRLLLLLQNFVRRCYRKCQIEFHRFFYNLLQDQYNASYKRLDKIYRKKIYIYEALKDKSQFIDRVHKTLCDLEAIDNRNMYRMQY